MASVYELRNTQRLLGSFFHNCYVIIPIKFSMEPLPYYLKKIYVLILGWKLETLTYYHKVAKLREKSPKGGIGQKDFYVSPISNDCDLAMIYV